ncbi:(2Fe-2S)-binding protein [Allokutzneria albata]|uniref:FhuF 2Fe-2S C-terminal domain-containing protein n=1 Tax=Allokutzneria albata TaxID=211114 RepID=A0A1H0AM71_ALLAB|nr:(2Fe-2S)-binding protein [Allokutzneria albata]SDN34515.1 FhuF 2Fe-2S C-terminal domain-containing protein [Allokutzneria albata]
MTVTAGLSPVGAVGDAGRGVLAATLDRVGGLPTTEVRHGLPAADEQWISCADLLADPAMFDRWRKRLADWLGERHEGQIPERTTSGYIMSWYLQVPGFLGGLLFHAARRVPSLRPADIAFRLSGDRPHPDGIALLSDEFCCLPEDPESHRPEATAVADERALAAVFRARFTAHAAKFVTAFGPGTRFGRRTLWAAATDALDTAGWLAGRCLGDEGSGVADSALFLPAAEAPLTSASTLRAVTGDCGRTVWTRRRESCCFHFALPDQPACTTCPRISEDERAERVLAR